MPEASLKAMKGMLVVFVRFDVPAFRLIQLENVLTCMRAHDTDKYTLSVTRCHVVLACCLMWMPKILSCDR